MDLHVDSDAIETMASDAESIAARQITVGVSFARTLDWVGPESTGSPVLGAALAALAHSWSKALHQFAEDARTLTAIVYAVDERYVTTEMRLAGAFASRRED